MTVNNKTANTSVNTTPKDTNQQAFEDMHKILSKLGKARTRLALEQRLVFDAAAAATGAEVAADLVAQDQAEVAVQALHNSDAVEVQEATTQDQGDHVLDVPVNASVVTSGSDSENDIFSKALADSLDSSDFSVSLEPTELLFIDGSVPNVNELLSAIPPSVEVFILDPELDGVEQIASAIEGRNGIDAIHIISHGDSAQLQLGNASLTTDSMRGEHADELATIGNSLSEHGDILVYGCNFGAGDEGKYATDLLAELTGADIAASDDLTGSSDLGGDWDLEVAAGDEAVETAIVVSADVRANYHGVLAPSAVQLNIAYDGTPGFDNNDDAGNDSDAHNGIVRVHDTVGFSWAYNTDAGGATDPHLQSLLPEGMQWTSVPPQGTGADSGIYDGAAYEADGSLVRGGDGRLLIVHLPDIGSTTSAVINPVATVIGVPHGTVLSGITFEFNSNEVANPVVSDAVEVTASSAPGANIRIESSSFRGIWDNEDGSDRGAVYQINIGVLADHETRSGEDAVKGAGELESNLTFDLDLTQFSGNTRLFNFLPQGETQIDRFGGDGASRNFEVFNGQLVWYDWGNPAGEIDDYVYHAADGSVPFAGDWTATQGAAGDAIAVTLENVDTKGTSFPTSNTYNRTSTTRPLAADERYFAAGQVFVWIPIADIMAGEDGILGTADDGEKDLTSTITNFDPLDATGLQSNFGAAVEDLSDNSRTFHAQAGVAPGIEGLYRESGTWGIVPTATYHYTGDGAAMVGEQLEHSIHFGANYGVTDIENVILGGIVDNTSMHVIPSTMAESWRPVDPQGDRSQYSVLREYPAAGGSVALIEGVDYRIEFATGGQGGDAGWSDWDEMDAATLADGDTSTVWTTDPTDAALGGNADPVSGIRDSITKYRFVLLRPLTSGSSLYGGISVEVDGPSTIEAGGDNTGGRTLAMFAVATSDNHNGWYSEAYDPSTEVGQDGDRLTLSNAVVRTDITVAEVVPGSGNSYLAGTPADFTITGTVTAPIDQGAPAQDVYVTNILPAGLFISDPSTVFPQVTDTQAVEYTDDGGATWTTTFPASGQATGVRWFYGDEDLNTALPNMGYRAIIPFDADNGQTFLNSVVISSPSDFTPDDAKDAQIGVVAVQATSVNGSEITTTPLVPVDNNISFTMQIANTSDVNSNNIDIVNILPYDGDPLGSHFAGTIENIALPNLPAGIDVYVTAQGSAALDNTDGALDGYADPGVATDAGFVTAGTVGSNWQYTLDDVRNGVAGAPAMADITGLRFVSNGTVPVILPAASSLEFEMVLTPNGNNGLGILDVYRNQYIGHVDEAVLPLAIYSPVVEATVVEPRINIETQVMLDPTGAAIDPANNAHWGETVSVLDGQNVTYRVQVTNTSGELLQNIDLQNLLPAGATLIDGSAAGDGDFSNLANGWSVDLGPNDVATLIYTVSTPDRTVASYTPNVTGTATDSFGQSANDQDDATAIKEYAPVLDLDGDNSSYDRPGTAVLSGANGGRIYQVNLEDGTSELVTTSTLYNGNINALATNPDAGGIVYYGNGTTMNYWDPATDTHHVLSDLSGLGEFAGGYLHSGGAAYYDGNLYIASEDRNGQVVDVFRVELSADGKGIEGVSALGLIPIAATAGTRTIGGMGDLIVTGDGADVTIYGATDRAGFWSFDTATNDFNVISNRYPGQLAADELGNLYVGNGTTIRTIDKDTGVQGAVVARTPASIADLTGVSPFAQIDPDGTFGYNTTFTEHGNPVAIADIDAGVIEDLDDVNTESATIVLTNAQASDVLAVGALPAGITAAIDTSVAGQITVTLTSDNTDTVSRADFANAIEAVTFENTSHTPDTTDRIVEVVVRDNEGHNSNTAVAIIKVIPVNDPPVAVNDSGSTAEEVKLVVDAANGLLSNDSDLEGDALTVTGYTVNGVAHTVGEVVALPEGNLTILADGSYTFDPAPNYNGTLPETITYAISDGNGGTASADLAIFVTEVNDLPVVGADQFTVNEDHSVAIDVLSNDSDPEGTALTITTVDGQAVVQGVPVTLSDGSGTVALTRNGTLVFTAANDYVGNSTFTYDVSDADGGVSQGTVTGVVAPVADRPIVTLNGNQHESAQFAANGGNLVATLNNGDTVTISGGNPILATDNRAATDAEYIENYGSTRDVIRADRGVPTTISFSGGSAPIGTLLAIADVDTPPDSIIIRGANGQVIEIDQLESLANQNSVFPVWNNGVSTLEGQNANNNTSEITVFDISGLGDITIETNGRLVEYTILTPNGNYATTFTEGDAPVTVTDATGNAIDVEDDIKVMTIQTGGIVDGSAERVTIAGHTFDLSVDANAIGFDIGGSFVNISYDAGTGQFTIVNNQMADGAPLILPQADMDLLLQQMVYENTSEDPTPGDRTLTFVATDTTNLESAPAISTITVIPVNDAPIIVQGGQIPDQVDVDAVAVTSVDINNVFADAEGDGLTYTVAGLPTGLSFDPATGLITGTPDSSASQGGPNNDGIYPITVTADDGNGGTTPMTFNWTVTNPGPTALDNVYTIDEDVGTVQSAILGNALLDNTGAGVDSDPDNDTLSVIPQFNTAGSNGGSFNIDAAGVITFNAGVSFDDLQVGETRDTVLSYTITDSEGGTSTANITVTVEGLNDEPLFNGELSYPDQHDLDGAPITPVDLKAEDLFFDPDGDDLVYTATGLPAGLTLDPTTGVISGTPDHSASQGGPNNNGVYEIIISVDDGHGGTDSSWDPFIWTIGNPAPTAIDNAYTVSEDAGPAVAGNALTDDSVAGQDNDPDGDPLSVLPQNNVAGTNGGIFAIDAAGVVTFDPNGEFENLGVGETRQTTLSYTITDNEGGESTANVVITVEGVNDVPTVVAGSEIPDQVNNDSDGINVNVSGAFTDPDRNDFLTYTAVGMPAGLSLDPKSGEITGEIEASASQGGPNNDGVYTIVVTADDANGGTVTDTFTWTVSNPVPLAFDNVYGVGEDDGSAVVGNALLDTNGANETDYDPDGDVLSVIPQTNIVGSNGGIFAIDAAGVVTFDPNGEFNGLAAGETQDTVLTYTITDADGATDTATVTVTVTGANDDPIIVPGSEIPDQSGDDADTIQPIDVSGVFGNTDTTNTLTFSASGLPTGITIDPDTGIISGTIDNSASQEGVASNGVHSVLVTADDGQGGTVSDTFVWTVANPGPTALDNVYGVSEDDGAAPVGNALTDNGAAGTDSDPDGDDLEVLPQADVVGSSGGIFAIDATGVVTFDPNGEFEDLPVGVTRDTTLAYTITDNEGGTSTALITVTVTGVNDTPETTGILDRDGVDATDVSFSVTDSFTDVDGDTLSFSATGLPTGLTISPEGVISGTIDHSASPQGPFNVTVTVDDGNGGTVSTSFVYTVTNPVPTAVDDSNSTDEDTAISVTAANGVITTNDTDPDGDVLNVIEVNGNVSLVGSVVTGDNGGRFTLNPDGSYDFDPGNAFQDMGAGETRETSIYYTISDGEGGTDIAQLTITVDGVNDTPVTTGPLGVQNDIDAVEITPLDVTTAFTIPDGITLTYSAENLPEGLSIDPLTGLVSGTPDNSASVEGPYTVTITGTTQDNVVYTTDLVWNISNPGPVASDDIASTPQDTPVSFSVIGNDTDPDGDDLHIDSVTQPAHGTVILNPDGTITYTPDAGFTGTETVTYVISDGEGGTDTAVITIEVGDVPVGTPVVNIDIPDVNNLDSDTVTLNVSGNFTDPDGQPLTFHATDLPPGLSIDPVTGVISGEIDHAASVGGPYTVTVTAIDPDGHLVSSVFTWGVDNIDPEANDDNVATPINTPISFNVLSNDVDTDGDILLVESVTQPNNGTVTVNVDGSITYIPVDGFTGTDTFTYTVSDQNGGQDTATVTIVVDGPAEPGQPVVDTPVDPQEDNDSDIVNVDVSGHFSDPDGDPLIFSATDLPPGLVIDPQTGVITGTLTPGASQDGPYQVTVTAVDPDGNQVTTTFPWTVANPVPVAVDDNVSTGPDTPVTINVLGNDSDPDGDPLTVTEVTDPPHGSVVINPDGSVTYTPDEGYEGTDSFTYTVSDGNGGTTTATVTVVVDPQAPVVITPGSLPDRVSLDADVIAPISVVSAFETQDNTDSLTYSVTGLPEGLVFNPTTGEISGTITPSASVSGPYSVVVTATDEGGEEASVTFNWAVSNPAPTAVDDGFEIEENEIFTGDVTPGTNGQDSDPDGDELTVLTVNGRQDGVSQPVRGSEGGTFVINPDGTYSFDPGTDFDYLPAGQVVTTTLEYTIVDGEGGSDTATVTATITGVNDGVNIIDPNNPNTPPVDPNRVIPPQTGIDSTEVPPLNVSVYFDDPDSEEVFTFSAENLPVGLVIDPQTGIISGTPVKDSSASGPYTVIVTATDRGGESNSTEVVYLIDNPAPVTLTDFAEVLEDEVVNGDVSVNDSDPDGDSLSFVVSQNPNHGIVTMNPDGTYIYTPNRNYNGVDSFTYTVIDADGASTTETVNITIIPVNDEPVAIVNLDDQENTIQENVNLDLSSHFADLDNDSLTYTETGLPDGLSINHFTGVITGTVLPEALDEGIFEVTITVNDGKGGVVSVRFIWDINPLEDVAYELSAGFRDSETVRNDIDIMNYEADGIIVKTVNQLKSLSGTSLDTHEIRNIFSDIERISGRPTDSWTVKGLTGFSLRMSVGDSVSDRVTDLSSSDRGQVIVETLVRERTLYVEVKDDLRFADDRSVREYRVTLIDGRPLPSWLRYTGQGLLIGERPVHSEVIQLKVSAVLSDGTTVDKGVTIQTQNGEIQTAQIIKGTLENVEEIEEKLKRSLEPQHKL